jgi:hypothetical protein
VTLALDESNALQFCVMVQAGMPAEDAIRYFCDSDDPLELAQTLKKWQSSAITRRAQKSLMGKSWHEMTRDERIRYGLDLHYSQLAYFLFSGNYLSMGPADKAKADTARQALEAKLAGTAGSTDPLSRWLEDLNSGRLANKLVPPPARKDS